jgi:hypothetical protein
MKKMKTTPIIFCLILLGCLLSATGCVSESTVKNQLSNPTDMITSILTVMPTTLVTQIPTECPVPGNGSYWIKIDPINNVSIGNPVFVSGTTNIPAGVELDFEIHNDQFRALPHSQPPYILGKVKIPISEGCINKFSFYSNTRALTRAGTYIMVLAWIDQRKFSEFPSAASEFYIIGAVNP